MQEVHELDKKTHTHKTITRTDSVTLQYNFPPTEQI